MSREPFKIDINDLAFFIHQAALDPHHSLDFLNEICDACIHFNFSGLCTNLIRIPAARKRLGNNKNSKLIAVIGFPFGDIPNEHKRLQAEWAAEQGAEELDVVPNYLSLHENKTDIFVRNTN